MSVLGLNRLPDNIDDMADLYIKANKDRYYMAIELKKEPPNTWSQRVCAVMEAIDAEDVRMVEEFCEANKDMGAEWVKEQIPVDGLVIGNSALDVVDEWFGLC